MPPSNYYIQYLNVITNMCEGHIGKALELLKSEVKETQDWPLIDECMNIEEAYSYMLRYFSEGANDSKRTQVFAKLQTRILNLAENVKRFRGRKESNNFYYSKLRLVSRQSYTLRYYTNMLRKMKQQHLFEALTDSTPTYSEKEINECVKNLFDYTWVSASFTEEDCKDFISIFKEDYLNNGQKAWMVSALTLSLLFYYDDKKMELLASLTDCAAPSAACRAMVGLSLVMMVHGNRFNVQNPYSLFDFCPNVSSTWCMMQMQYLYQVQSMNIGHKMKSDILPLMMDLQKFLSPEELQQIVEGEELDLPPGVDPDKARKIRQGIFKFSENARYGMDMNYHLFSNMKRGPFFSEVRNWFKPFSLNDAPKGNVINNFTTVGNGDLMCDSDRYSLSFVFQSFPSQIRQQIESAIEQADIVPIKYDEDMLWIRLKDLYAKVVEAYPFTMPTDNNLCGAWLYIQDIYRFFTIKMKGENEGNPFVHSEEMIILNNNLIGPRIAEKDLLIVINEAYKLHLYPQVLTLLDILSKKRSLNQEELKMCFHCNASLQEYKKAIFFFEQIEKNGGTVSVHLLEEYATCLSKENRHEEAVKIMQQLYENTSDPSDLYAYAQALRHCKKYEKAKEVLFKAEYYSPDNLMVQKELALCLLFCHNPQQAVEYYEKVLANEKPSLQRDDYKNVAHAYFATGNIPKALEKYRESRPSGASNFYFNEEDIQLLKNLGLTSVDISLMESAV